MKSAKIDMSHDDGRIEEETGSPTTLAVQDNEERVYQATTEQKKPWYKQRLVLVPQALIKPDKSPPPPVPDRTVENEGKYCISNNSRYTAAATCVDFSSSSNNDGGIIRGAKQLNNQPNFNFYYQQQQQPSKAMYTANTTGGGSNSSGGGPPPTVPRPYQINQQLNPQSLIPFSAQHQYYQQQQQSFRLNNLKPEYHHQQQQQQQPTDYTSEGDEEDRPPAPSLDANIYTTKKTVMTILCLIIIIMANSIQLKFVIKNGRAVFNQFYSAQIGLGVTSVLFASFIGLLLMYTARLNYNDEYKQRKLDFINNAIMILLFILCILNIFLVAMN